MIDDQETKFWFKNSKRHRINGPAVEYLNGDKLWYINNIHLTEEQHLWKTTLMKINKEIDI